MLMPMTMASWLTVTSRPRRCDGAISAIYIGEVMAAKPTPIPPTARQMQKSKKVRGSAVPMADTRKHTAATHSVARRPIESLSHMPAKGPAIEPRIALLTAKPVPVLSSWKCSSKKISAPLMIERS